MSQQTNMTFRVSGDDDTPQGIPLSVEKYLSSDETLFDRLQKGPGGTLDHILKLKDELDRLTETISTGAAKSST